MKLEIIEKKKPPVFYDLEEFIVGSKSSHKNDESPG